MTGAMAGASTATVVFVTESRAALHSTSENGERISNVPSATRHVRRASTGIKGIQIR
jgi:hypothetical protein